MKTKPKKILICLGALVFAFLAAALLVEASWPRPRILVLSKYEYADIRSEDAEQLSARALMLSGLDPQDFSMQRRNRNQSPDPFWIRAKKKYTLWFPIDMAKSGDASYAVYLSISEGSVVSEVKKSK